VQHRVINSQFQQSENIYIIWVRDRSDIGPSSVRSCRQYVCCDIILSVDRIIFGDTRCLNARPGTLGLHAEPMIVCRTSLCLFRLPMMPARYSRRSRCYHAVISLWADKKAIIFVVNRQSRRIPLVRFAESSSVYSFHHRRILRRPQKKWATVVIPNDHAWLTRGSGAVSDCINSPHLAFYIDTNVMRTATIIVLGLLQKQYSDIIIRVVFCSVSSFKIEVVTIIECLRNLVE